MASWEPALRDGLTRHYDAVGPAGRVVSGGVVDVAMAFYGDVFRPPGEFLSVGEPILGADDVAPGLEQELLAVWWAEAARVDETVTPPDADILGAPRWVHWALRQLVNSRRFAGVALGALVGDLKQVARYLTDPGVRAVARERVVRLVEEDTRVVVAHSLGSVVAYEALCGLPGHGVRALVTLGSPLGVANLIFDRLEPAPIAGRGVWPGGEGLMWTNVADARDVVALEKDLKPRFGERIRNVLVDNGVTAHAVVPYLTDRMTGSAIAEGLT